MSYLDVPYDPIGKPVESFISFNKANFKTVTWNAPENVKYRGRIIYVHGFAEHSSLYTEIFDKLSQLGYDIFFFDQRGAGETSRGSDVGNTDEKHTFQDLDFMIEHNLKLRRKDDEKFYLMGHSMGGGIVLNYAVKGKYKRYIKTIIASAPLIELHPDTKPSRLLWFFSPAIRVLAPNFVIDSQLRYDFITSNTKWKNYLMSHDKKLIGRAKQFYDMFTRGEALTKQSYVKSFDKDIPVLIVHGTDDRINDLRGSKKFINLLDSSVDKKLEPIEGGKHSLFIEREEIFNNVFSKVTEFLASH
ncbi:Piso0_002811 [Millerozyma farinosa CBS 7064]|uniref:Piso0_002811 protein n=1 Tax=Pichia sorbitophila (strain ATCC MYA-4447 / BCRC 22081 / CBS 7064 / NBRC 10061 / NRRL Y-12695) TaxID=559304 RepID=G8YDK6_PICSO|nr:Piso0_002811 [Millerozyma farinosa CBS 7064]